MKFFLSVSKDRVVSLWDTARQARQTAGETYVAMTLTPEQEQQVKDAAKRATSVNKA